eukprot:1835212-Rhodomonas_salina.1
MGVGWAEVRGQMTKHAGKALRPFIPDLALVLLGPPRTLLPLHPTTPLPLPASLRTTPCAAVCGS